MQHADIPAQAQAPIATNEELLEAEHGESQPEEEEEQEAKTRTRSRFSAALRSLSKPKAKKEKESESKEKVKEKEADKSKEKQLKSSKEKPKDKEKDKIKPATEPARKSVEQLEEIVVETGAKPKKPSLTRRLLLGGLKSKSKVRPHSLNAADEISLLRRQDETATPTNTAPSTSRSSVQITISGKKIEPAKGKSRKSAASETDYLTPIPTATTTPTTTTITTTTTTAKPPTTKSTTTSTSTSTTVTTKDTSRTTKVIVGKLSKEREAKKPLKPKKKLSPAQSKESEEKIVITESLRDTPPRERAPAKPSRVAATIPIQSQSASSSGAARKQSSSSSSSRTVSSKKTPRTVTVVASGQSLPSRQERESMQQQQQRGHRLNRSITTATHTAPTTPLSQAEEQQIPIEIELEPEAEQQQLEQLEQPTQSSELLVPPSYPPPPLPPGTPNRLAPDAISIVSSAESANAGQEEEEEPSPTVRFAVGSAVRPPASALESALAAAAGQDLQPSSSESQRSDSSSLRRLNFAQQQRSLGDHDSIEGRRETLRYQSVASEYSNDSKDSQSEDVEAKDEASKPMPAFGDLTMDQEMEPAIMSPSSEKREHLYKILVIGELGTGKTSFIKRYVHQFFSQNYRATIGVDFALKVLHWDANTIVRLQLWDIAGQERFGNMTRVYYKEAVGAFIVFDVTRSGTFDCVSKWKEDLDSKVQLPDGSPIPCILLANKCDQDKQGIVTQAEKMDDYVRENGFAGWFETSAKENINIDEAARALVNKILINDKLITAADLADSDKFNLNGAGDANGADAKNKCAC